jgi:hypothetical protein
MQGPLLVIHEFPSRRVGIMANQLLNQFRKIFISTFRALRSQTRKGLKLVQKIPDMVTILSHPALFLLGRPLLRSIMEDTSFGKNLGLPMATAVSAIISPLALPVAAVTSALVGCMMIAKKVSKHN